MTIQGNPCPDMSMDYGLAGRLIARLYCEQTPLRKWMSMSITSRVKVPPKDTPMLDQQAVDAADRQIPANQEAFAVRWKTSSELKDQTSSIPSIGLGLEL